MEQCIQMMIQAIQQGQLDPAMPIGALIEQVMGQQGEQSQGLGGPVAPQGQPSM